MNQVDMNKETKRLKLELEAFNSDNFADKQPRTGYYESWTRNFTEFKEDLEALVKEAYPRFPEQGIKETFEQGITVLNVRRRAVYGDDFETGKQYLLKCIKIIEENAMEKKKPDNLGIPTIPIITKNPEKIFFSYYSNELLTQIEMVLGYTSKAISLEHISRKQPDSLETVIQRVNEIKSCSGAIICLPLEEEPDNFNSTAYIDLGACITRFPDQTLLIYESGDLPDSLTSKVKTFRFVGNLDFQTGMELSGMILNLFKR